MMRTYVSTVIPHSADAVWATVKDFSEYRWGEGGGDARIENSVDPNTPGAIRSFACYGRPSRQRLTDYSAQERTQSKPLLPDDGSELPVTPCDDDIDLNDEDTDTVDDLPVATERHSHVPQ